MALLAWSPLSPDARKFVLALPDGSTSTIRTHGPGPHVIEWSQGINLPAVAVVAPLEFAVREAQDLPNFRTRFYGYFVVGLLCWWMTGRFFDELAQWRKTKTLLRAPRADLTFALIAFPSTILMAAAFGFAGRESRVLSAWAVIWLAITSADMFFRVAQLIRHRRRPKFS
jgi:hypothetical protein